MSDSGETKLAVIANDISYIKSEMSDMKGKMFAQFVTQDQFMPLRERLKFIENIIFGLIGIIVIAVLGAIINLVVSR